MKTVRWNIFEVQRMTDNKSAFAVNRYDENVRKVIPFYDEIYEQIFSVIQAHCGSKPLAARVRSVRWRSKG